MATLLSLSISLAQAKTICTMTFNSSDEKQVFQKNLSPLGYDLIELVPDNKDPTWFKKSCASTKSCDILVVSGHFGGLFFGEKASTLSLGELTEAREKFLCPNILDKAKAVYLMGCNTLSYKTPDHRSVNDYLRVLVGDGFPLNLAEEVAASRYLNFGKSMAEFMISIFNKSQMIVGFESTGPLGADAAPMLQAAFNKSTLSDKNTTGLSRDALLTAFRDTNLRVVKPYSISQDKLKEDALSKDDQVATIAWKTILQSQNISKQYDFIIKNQNDLRLTKIIKEDSELAQNVLEKMLSIYHLSTGLSQIQVRVVHFLKLQDLINQYEYEDTLIQISSSILANEIDYISADQLCSLFKEFREINLIGLLNKDQKNKIKRSLYGNTLLKCAGLPTPLHAQKKAALCLKYRTTYDWACLTENPTELDVESCDLARSRNNDLENADDMMWFCYSKMSENHYLNRAECLELTHHFSILGNQLKMNWNCLNRIQ